MIKKTYSYGCTHTGCGCTIGVFQSCSSPFIILVSILVILNNILKPTSLLKDVGLIFNLF